MTARPQTFAPEVPKLGADQISYEWLHDDLTHPVVCHLTYTPAERGSREGVVQMEPDLDEEVTLDAAYLMGVNILPIIEDYRDRIEGLALDNLHAIRAEHEADRRMCA